MDSCVEVIWRCQNQRTLDITTAQLTGDTFSVGELSISKCFKTNTRGWKLYYMVIFAPSSIDNTELSRILQYIIIYIYHHLQHIVIFNITSCIQQIYVVEPIAGGWDGRIVLAFEYENVQTANE